MSTAAGSQKDTIYVDVDDEITAIIDKVTTSKNKIVALVLPKRAVVLQSIVNMKLLKRTADDAKKHLVLISTEAGIMPLAGVVGLHVAKSLQSKPSIPAAPGSFDDAPDDVGDELAEQEAIEDYDPADNKARSIGELAAARQAALAADDDAIEIDDIDNLDDEDLDTDKKKETPKKDKKLAVPNFNKFRLWIILGSAAVVLLIVGGVFAFVILPKATITVATDSRDITVNKTITANTAATTVDVAKLVLPAKSVSQQKTDTQKAAATGQKNIGTKATGSVTMKAKVCGTPSVPANVPAGTGVSANGKTYITQDDISFSVANIGGGCINFNGGSTDIASQNPGAEFNTTGNTAFTVAGRSEVTASGSANGGTDQNVKVVSQADIDGLKAKITSGDTKPINDSLKNNLSAEGWQAITASFAGAEPQVTTSANVGDQADEISVTQTTTYTMIGVKQADLKKIITADVDTQLKGDKQQNLQNDGASGSKFTIISGTDPNNIQLTLAATATVGPELSQDEVKKIAAGKKLGDIKNELEKIEGVENVTATYSPFWVGKVPSKDSKITVVFEKSTK